VRTPAGHAPARLTHRRTGRATNHEGRSSAAGGGWAMSCCAIVTGLGANRFRIMRQQSRIPTALCVRRLAGLVKLRHEPMASNGGEKQTGRVGGRRGVAAGSPGCLGLVCPPS